MILSFQILLDSCKNLSTLRITMAPLLTDHAIEIIGQHTPKLSSLDISGCSGGDRIQ